MKRAILSFAAVALALAGAACTQSSSNPSTTRSGYYSSPGAPSTGTTGAYDPANPYTTPEQRGQGAAPGSAPLPNRNTPASGGSGAGSGTGGTGGGAGGGMGGGSSGAAQ